jgi:hypothetical protein
VNRRCRHTGLHELDTPAVDDRMVSGGSHRDRPAEMIGNAQARTHDRE